MSIDNAIRNRDALLVSAGKVALNIRYPKEFEVYICAFELIDGAGKTLKYFIFPIMPSSIEEREPEATNIKRTAAGVVSLSTTAFIPRQIVLSGNFGRKFKVLLGADYVDLLNAFKTTNGNVTAQSIVKGTANLFDDRIKTGYGCLQVLKEILDESLVVDENGARRLIFYNPSFGTSYVVKLNDKRINMSQETNLLHNYTVNLTAIAPLEALKSQGELERDATQLNITNYMQKQTNRLVNSLTAML